MSHSRKLRANGDKFLYDLENYCYASHFKSYIKVVEELLALITIDNGQPWSTELQTPRVVSKQERKV